MKPFKNWNEVKSIQDKPKLPPGGYICKIMDAEEVEFDGKNGTFSKLQVSMDIYEGEYNGFYADDYRNQQQEDKRWGCVYSLYLPTDDGSDKDEFTKRKFKTFTECVEDSNPNYHWDWNEKGLKGKTVGMVFRNEQWEWDGKTGFKCKPYLPKSAEDIAQGKFKMPQGKLLSGSTVNTNSTSSDPNSIIDGDLPF